MIGVVLVLLGILVWFSTYAMGVSAPLSYLFMFVGGLLIGVGISKAIT